MVPFFVSVHAHISENVCEIWRPIWQTRTTRCIDIAITFAKRISLKYCQQSPIHSKNYRFYYGLAASTQHIDRRYDFSYKRHMYYSTHSTPHRTHAVVKLCFFLTRFVCTFHWSGRHILCEWVFVRNVRKRTATPSTTTTTTALIFRYIDNCCYQCSIHAIQNE